MKRFTLPLYVVLFLFTCCLQALAAPEFKIITLQHRFAEDILPSIQPLVVSGGTVSAMQNHLIIRTSPENMAELEDIIATLDVARPNFKITISRQDSLENADNNVSVSGHKRIGDFDIRTGNSQQRSRDGVQIGIQNNQNHLQSSGHQFINVIDGERAFIRVGQSVPFTQEWVTLTHRYASIQRTTEFADISTGFAVRPRIIGTQIEVEITPRIAQLNQSGFIDFEEVTTVVRVRRGEWLDLAGSMQQKDEVSRAILSWQQHNKTQNNQLFIRVE